MVRGRDRGLAHPGKAPALGGHYSLAGVQPKRALSILYNTSSPVDNQSIDSFIFASDDRIRRCLHVFDNDDNSPVIVYILRSEGRLVDTPSLNEGQRC